jgi:hypothetical protein
VRSSAAAIAIPSAEPEPTGLERFVMRDPPPGYRWAPTPSDGCAMPWNAPKIELLPPAPECLAAQSRLARLIAAAPAKKTRQLEDAIANAKNSVGAWSEGAVNPPGWEQIARKYLSTLELMVTP